MAWPEDPLPAIRHERHFGDRLVRCFAERPPHLPALLAAAVARNPVGEALVAGESGCPIGSCRSWCDAPPPGSPPTASRSASGSRCCSATGRSS